MILILLNIFLLFNISRLSDANKISLIGATASQIGTWSNHHASLAIDGNIFTYSVACKTCDPEDKSTLGWWKIDFRNTEDIAGVEIFASINYPDRDYILETDVFVITTSGETKLCGDYKERHAYIRPIQRIVIICKQILPGRSVTIQRKPKANVRSDAISLAEIIFYSEVGDWDSGTTSIKITMNNENYIPKGKAVPFEGSSQSGTYASNTANLANDGNADTFSLAISNTKWQHAWWQGDLGKSFLVTDAMIISSSDPTNAQYLQTFNIMVSIIDHSNDPGFHKAQKCTTITDPADVPTKTSFGYKCLNPIDGRYVIIKSTSGPIGMSEVTAFVR